MGGLINYMDRTPVETEEEINSPVTGYGNEALWEYSDKRGPR